MANCSGNPPGITRAAVSAGSESERGSNSATNAPAAAKSSRCSAYPKVNAWPAASATTGSRSVGAPTASAGSHIGDVTSLWAAAAIAPTLTCVATSCAIAEIAPSAAWPCSTAVTSPKCREGTDNSSVRGRAPNTRSPARSAAAVRMSRCRADPTRLRMTPAILIPASAACATKPCNRADKLWLYPFASTTNTTGAPSRAAISAVDPFASSTRPSKSPMTPSTTAMSAFRLPCRNNGPIRSSPTSTLSRLRPGLPVASAWYPGSI
ncbi:Uncharacterised protein [Mycobacteroides abscessus subsp. abscessus]|nr:Uncharacterised protein [Mycobacteroides abscessus subsp. abscessus]